MSGSRTTAGPLLTLEQRRLLGGWRDITEDVIRLAYLLARVPEACTCGASATSGGDCPCCRGDRLRSVTGCADCGAQVRDVAERVAALDVDTIRYFAPFADLVKRLGSADADRHLTEAVRELHRFSGAFWRLAHATDEYASGCAGAHLGALKATARDVEGAAYRLNRLLLPEGDPLVSPGGDRRQTR